MSEYTNRKILLISGETGTGKSTSFMPLREDKGVVYVNTEADKILPFKHDFLYVNLSDPMKIFSVFNKAEKNKDIHTIIIDSFTYLMDMFESQYVLTSNDTRSAWGDYAQYAKRILQKEIKESSKNVILTGHTLSTFNEEKGCHEVSVPIKGALKNQGVESYFGSVVSTKKVLVKDLEEYDNAFLNITDEERMLGYKHVFQTNLTKRTIGERIRSPIGMFSRKETFIDNNIEFLLQRLNEYFG